MSRPASSPTAPLQIDQTTVLSLLGMAAVLATAYAFSLRVLPRSSGPKARALFIWLLFDALIRSIFEGSFLWNCFFVYAPHDPAASPSSSAFLPRNVHFLGRQDRTYGAAHGSGAFSLLWQEYARADRRWAGTDLTLVSLEIPTVFIAGPLALWCAIMVRRAERDRDRARDGRKNVVGNNGGSAGNRKWFWMTVLATGELYGGWMIFAPEWLSGSPNLDTSNFMYKWVYLFFFNTLWAAVPLWVLVEAYKGITGGPATTTTKGGRAGGSKRL